MGWPARPASIDGKEKEESRIQTKRRMPIALRSPAYGSILTTNLFRFSSMLRIFSSALAYENLR
jgi:hypothetical protein